MLNYIKRKLALLDQVREIVEKIEKKGEETKQLEAAFAIIRKELVNPHTKDEVMDSLTLVFETLNKNI